MGFEQSDLGWNFSMCSLCLTPGYEWALLLTARRLKSILAYSGQSVEDTGHGFRIKLTAYAND